MNRSELEKNLSLSIANLEKWVQANPLRGVLAGLLAGIVFMAFRGAMLPLLLLAVVVYAALWVFASEDRPEDAQFYERKPEEPTMNGQASPSDRSSGHDA